MHFIEINYIIFIEDTKTYGLDNYGVSVEIYFLIAIKPNIYPPLINQLNFKILAIKKTPDHFM